MKPKGGTRIRVWKSAQSEVLSSRGIWMTRTIISPSDLSQRTREILDRVQQGELAVVASEGAERIVLLDALDFRLLRALALCATGEGDEGELLEAQMLRDYLAERISLGKAAELLQLTRFELEGSFQRLGISIRRGARSIEDAQAEIAAARLNRDRPTSDAASALELAELRLHRIPDRNPGLTQGHANSGVAGRHEAGARQPGYAAYIS